MFEATDPSLQTGFGTCTQPPEVSGSAVPGYPASASKKASLLIVSEQPDLLTEIAALLGQEFDVQPAAGVAEAMQALTCHHFDLLLADQALRPMTGLDLLDGVRRLSPRTTGILLIGTGDVGQAGEALRGGRIHACILHPLRADGLLSVLRGAARQILRERDRALLQHDIRQLQLNWHQTLLGQGFALKQTADLLARNAAELEEDNRRLRQYALELECQAATDPLTGLFNRRAIESLAEAELSRRARHPGPMALGLIDADRFKRINTRHLLPGGDQALIGISRALAENLRASDRVGRFGGEEFLVVAPHTNLTGAAALAERLRSAVEQTTISYNGRPIPVTVSVGFAVVEANQTCDSNRLRHVAASALAEAKSAGRNCSVIRALASV